MAEDMMIGMGLFGGVLIGLASAVLLIFSGRIAGISGILGGLLYKWDDSASWRLPFILGIPAGVWLVSITHDYTVNVQIEASTPVLVIAGLLVGFGTRLGSGCTSGHGVCGLGRLSQRSIVATGTFMVTAALTVFVMRHVVGG